ncbi:MAG: J domain-containing protein [Patescibacteria group bacterium]|nr:J domain-containing protein [Patescibacteria group bacterium]
MTEDHYNTLGLRRDASQADIEKAYRDLARKFHPDLNPDDKKAKEKFQKVQAAFDVLSNAEKREMYDRYGSSFESMGAGGPYSGARRGRPGFGEAAGFGGGAGGGFRFDDVDLGDLFGQGFAQGQQQAPGGFGDFFRQFRRESQRTGKGTAPRRGTDIQHEVQIPFGTAVVGGQVEITLARQSGKTERINIKIPAGIEDGKRIRVRGQGEVGPASGPPGDILITVRVAPHPCFSRQGGNLVVRVPVSLSEAALGAKIDVPSPQGTVTLTVPPGTSSGTKLRVKGHGVPSRDGTAGDLLAELSIILPKQFDPSEQEQIRAMDQRQPLHPRDGLRW